MLHEVFYWILNMSIIASAFGVLLYCLRGIKKFPKFGSYVLWFIILIRLLCPLGMNSSYSLLNMLNKLSRKVIIKTVTVDLGIDQQFSFSNTIQAASSYEPFQWKTNLLEQFFKIGSIIWLVIAVASILAMFMMYFLTNTELKNARHLKDNIYSSPMVSAPTVIGILKPKIVLPMNVEEEQLEFILAHERVHIRRHDNIWRMLAILTACIHWFNPLIWWFLKTFFSDMELACDATTIKGMKEEERKNYARTLLAFANRDKTIFATAFANTRVRVRIESILSFKKLTLFSIIIFVGMVVIIAYLLLTNAGW